MCRSHTQPDSNYAQKTESQKFVDPRFMKTLVLVRSRVKNTD